MDWLKNYHEDHMNVLLLLSKLEGNLKDLASGASRPNITIELEEFGQVLREVVIPHFKNEEGDIYPKAAAFDKAFINAMYQEHYALYKLFDQYLAALNPLNSSQLIQAGTSIINLLKEHIEKEELELPNLLK